MKKIKLIDLIVILLIVFGIAAFGGYYIITERNEMTKKIDELSNEVNSMKSNNEINTKQNNNTTTNTQQNNNTTTNTTNLVNEEKTNKTSNDKNDKYVAKIDELKDYVYDAEYPTIDYNKEFQATYTKYELKNYIVPYINLDSKDAKKINETIEENYYKTIWPLKKDNKIKDAETNYSIKYRYYLNDNILSVIIITNSYDDEDIEESGIHGNFLTYNFDLKTGKLINYEDVYQAAGYTKESIREKVITATRKVLVDKYELDKVETGEMTVSLDAPKTLNEYVDNSMNNYDKDVKDGKMMDYIGENGKLFVILHVRVPFEGEGARAIAEIE